MVSTKQRPVLVHIIVISFKEEPVSYGNEILKKPIGQRDFNNPDYCDIIAGLNNSNQTTAF